MIRLAEVLMEDWHMYDEASTVLRWARELFPEEEEAARLLVEALSKSGEEEEARKLSNELGPRDDPEDLMTHAIAQAAAFDYPKALELIGRAIALSPDEEKFYARRGLIHFNAGAYDEAAYDLVRSAIVGWWVPTPDSDLEVILRGFKKIRSEVKGDPLAFKLIDIWAKLTQKKPAAAKAMLSKIKDEHWAVDALRLPVASSEPLQRKYLASALEKAPEEIVLLIRKTRMDRDDPWAYEQLTRLAPVWADAHCEASACYARLRDLDKALEHANAACEKHPSYFNSLKQRAEVHEARHDLESAQNDLDELVELYDDEEKPDEDDWDGELWREELNSLRTFRARIRRRLRDMEGAEDDYDLACELACRNNVWPFFERAKFYQIVGRREDALKDLDRGLSAVEWPEALGLRWRLRLKMGDREGAEKDKKRYREMMDNRRKSIEHSRAVPIGVVRSEEKKPKKDGKKKGSSKNGKKKKKKS